MYITSNLRCACMYMFVGSQKIKMKWYGLLKPQTFSIIVQHKKVLLSLYSTNTVQGQIQHVTIRSGCQEKILAHAHYITTLQVMTV